MQLKVLKRFKNNNVITENQETVNWFNYAGKAKKFNNFNKGCGNLALLESREIAKFFKKISHEFCEICEIHFLMKILPLIDQV